MKSTDELDHDRRLWRSVILQAFLDATTPSAKPIVRQEAIDWLTKPNRQFNDVCELAGLEADRVRAQATVAPNENRRTYGLNGTRKANDHPPAKRGRQITFNGQTMNVAQWARSLG